MTDIASLIAEAQSLVKVFGAMHAVLTTDDGGANVTRTVPVEILGRLADALEREHAALENLRKHLEGLIAQSRGVDGLHLNGAIATWNWLFDYEWLPALRGEE